VILILLFNIDLGCNKAVYRTAKSTITNDSKVRFFRPTYDHLSGYQSINVTVATIASQIRDASAPAGSAIMLRFIKNIVIVCTLPRVSL
jgi:hypothetical protein